MIIDPPSASKFIAVYKELLLEIDRTAHDERKSDLIKRLAAARSRLSSDPSLIEQALAALKSKSLAVDPEVVASLRSREVENWVFLRDTKLHSLFVHPSEHRAYGVLGLNDQIRDIVGASVWSWKLAWFNTLAGSFAMWLVARIIWLGKTIETASIARIKRSGRRPVLFEIWIVNKFEEFPGDSFFPSAKVSLLAPCFATSAVQLRYPPSNSTSSSSQGIAGSLLRPFTNRSRLKGSFFLSTSKISAETTYRRSVALLLSQNDRLQ
mgnify:CR=1 FL=1